MCRPAPRCLQILKRRVDALTVAPDHKDVASARRESAGNGLADTAAAADDNADVSLPHFAALYRDATGAKAPPPARRHPWRAPVSCLARKVSMARAKNLGLTMGKNVRRPGSMISRAFGRQSKRRSAVGRPCENFPNVKSVGAEIVCRVDGTRNDSSSKSWSALVRASNLLPALQALLAHVSRMQRYARAPLVGDIGCGPGSTSQADLWLMTESSLGKSVRPWPSSSAFHDSPNGSIPTAAPAVAVRGAGYRQRQDCGRVPDVARPRPIATRPPKLWPAMSARRMPRKSRRSTRSRTI